MIKVNAKKRDIEDTIWSVLTSFGYTEVEKTDSIKEESKNEKGKYCFFDNDEIGTLNSGNISNISMAETAAMCAEAAIAAGIDDTELYVGDDDVYEMLGFFGLEEVVFKKDGISGFYAKCEDTVFAEGSFENDIITCTFSVKDMLSVLDESGIGMPAAEMSASIVFAEKNAEGIAYDVAYNLRINGCIIEYYTEGMDIEECEKYALTKGISAVIRAFSDGTILIKDFAKNEIIETSYQEFLGYYDEDEDCDCGCGHHHHHGEDCQ